MSNISPRSKSSPPSSSSGPPNRVVVVCEKDEVTTPRCTTKDGVDGEKALTTPEERSAAVTMASFIFDSVS